jgi:hypothetical protein
VLHLPERGCLFILAAPTQERSASRCAARGKGGVVVALTRRRSKKVDEALSKLGGGQGVVVFFGMAKPVRTPLIGPPRAPQPNSNPPIRIIMECRWLDPCWARS